MNQSKIWWSLFVALVIGTAIPLSMNAQSKSLPSNIYFTGTVNYDYGMDAAKAVKCYLDLRFSKGTVSGYTNYGAEYNGMASELEGTVKAKSNGTYDLDVYVSD